MIDAVIGAGPNAFSATTHSRHLRVPFGLLGGPIVMWREHTPKGMVPKFRPLASDLGAPDDAFPSECFRNETRPAYPAMGTETPPDTLIEHGIGYQRRHSDAGLSR